AATGRDTLKTGRRIVGGEDDRVVRPPAGFEGVAAVLAERDGRAAQDRDLLELSSVSLEEADPMAVRRDERRSDAGDACQKTRVELVEGTYGELRSNGSG